MSLHPIPQNAIAPFNFHIPNIIIMFKFHQMIALKISKLVSKVYNNQTIELPLNVDESYYKNIPLYAS
ncbi:hypothetical protein [Floridanema aerugineum]|uniref:Uncharacterized protein n=1 Tax=Floridaenema aerugineum BLCC-F46 TaxID=3153654 RepID=A0ABV4X0C2_9CYAN